MTREGWKVPVAIAVIGLLGTIATAMIGNWGVIFPANGSGPGGTGSATSSTSGGKTTTPAPPAGSDRIPVQNVYNVPQARGLAIIASQGFTNVRVLRVCSNSVGVGRIREVLLDNGAALSDETALVSQNGSTGIEIAPTTKIAGKVSTGQSCS